MLDKIVIVFIQEIVMVIQIRPMSESDLDAVYDIEKNAHISPWSREILLQCIVIGYDCRVIEIMATNKTFIGGYIIIRHSDSIGHILNLCIAKSFQSKGYGRALLVSVIQSFSELCHIKSLVLEVRPSNSAAIHLYHSLGFEQVDIKKGYYNEGIVIEDAILLRKILRNELQK